MGICKCNLEEHIIGDKLSNDDIHLLNSLRKQFRNITIGNITNLRTHLTKVSFIIYTYDTILFYTHSLAFNYSFLRANIEVLNRKLVVYSPLIAWLLRREEVGWSGVCSPVLSCTLCHCDGMRYKELILLDHNNISQFCYDRNFP